MPTYDYRCPQGHEFELFQRMSEPPVAACPKCGAQAERLFSAGAGLLFKGSGFYITDYRPEGYKQAAAAEQGGGAPNAESGAQSEATQSEGAAPKPEPKASKAEGATGKSESARSRSQRKPPPKPAAGAE